MKRRAFIASVVSVLGVPLAGEAQRTGRIYWIGDLREGPSRPPQPFVDAMRELGWIEGQHFKLERRNADRREQLPALAAELVRLKVDLILTGGTPAARAAKGATNTIPIVFSVADDPPAAVEAALTRASAATLDRLLGPARRRRGRQSQRVAPAFNAALLGWCQRHQVRFTRGRPDRKNDPA